MQAERREFTHAETQPRMLKLRIYEKTVSGDKDLADLGFHAGIPILKYSELLEKL